MKLFIKHGSVHTADGIKKIGDSIEVPDGKPGEAELQRMDPHGERFATEKEWTALKKAMDADKEVAALAPEPPKPAAKK